VTTFLSFTIVGIVVGCIYALTSTGLVVTYISSGIFNFAHAGIGMLAAFTYWELTVKDGWPDPLALLFVLFVLAPLLGVLIDRLLKALEVHTAGAEQNDDITLAALGRKL